MYFFGSDSNFPLQSSQQNPISCFSYSTVFVGLTSLPVSGQVLLMGSSNRISSSADFPDFFLNSFTLPMYFFGSASNLPTQSMQQKPIVCFSYSDVLPATMSFPVMGHFLLIGSSKEISSSADFEDFFLNSFTLPMYFFVSASNLPTQSMQQNPISCFSYSDVFPDTMSFPVMGHFLLIGSSNATAPTAIPAHAMVSAVSVTARLKVFILAPPTLITIELLLFLSVHVVACLAVRGGLELVQGAFLLRGGVLGRRHQRGRQGLPAGLVALGRLLGRDELVGAHQLLEIVVRPLAGEDVGQERVLALVERHHFLDVLETAGGGGSRRRLEFLHLGDVLVGLLFELALAVVTAEGDELVLEGERLRRVDVLVGQRALRVDGLRRRRRGGGGRDLDHLGGRIDAPVDVDARDRLGQVGRAAVGHRRLPEVDVLQLLEAREARQPLVGHLGAVEVDVLEFAQPLERSEAVFAHARLLAVEPAEVLEAGQRLQAAVGHAGPRQVEVDQLLGHPF